MLKTLLHVDMLLPALAMMVAGFLVFLVLVNQRILVIRDSLLKMPVLIVTLLALTAGGFFLPLALPPFWRTALPAAILAVILAGEFRLRLRRRAWAGSEPVDTVFHDVPWLKPVTTTDLVCHRYEVAFPEWKGPPFRIVHLTDFHVNTSFDEGYYRAALGRAAALDADFAFFTGDYVTRTESIPILERILRPVSKRGDFAVLGNHDHWTDPARIRRVVERAGIRMLAQTSETITLEGHPIHVSGCDYAGYSDIRFPPIPEGPGLKLALCHTPDGIFELSRKKVHAVFSGHNHAGQARVPGLGAVIVPSRFGRLFDHGHFIVGGTHLFVSSGVGAATPPLRFYCQPDIFVIDVTGVDQPRGIT
jgi:predicted MPP superfamily phosphohydrolase